MANPTPNEVSADTATATDDQQGTPNLREMKRADLEAYAAEHGIADPAGYPNIPTLIEAIEAGGAAVPDDDDADTDDEAADEAEPAEPEAEPEEPRYRVLKAVTLDDGRTVMPGEEMTIGADWPARRAGQLVRQKYLRPINDQARDAAEALTAEGDDDGNSVQD